MTDEGTYTSSIFLSRAGQPCPQLALYPCIPSNCKLLQQDLYLRAKVRRAVKFTDLPRIYSSWTQEPEEIGLVLNYSLRQSQWSQQNSTFVPGTAHSEHTAGWEMLAKLSKCSHAHISGNQCLGASQKPWPAAALIRGCKNPKTTSSDTRISIYQMLRCRVLACLLQFCRPTAVLEAVWELSACALTSLRWKGAGVSGQHAHQSFGTESTPFKSTPQVLTAQTNPNQECVDFQTDLFL